MSKESLPPPLALQSPPPLLTSPPPIFTCIGFGADFVFLTWYWSDSSKATHYLLKMYYQKPDKTRKIRSMKSEARTRTICAILHSSKEDDLIHIIFFFCVLFHTSQVCYFQNQMLHVMIWKRRAYSSASMPPFHYKFTIKYDEFMIEYCYSPKFTIYYPSNDDCGNRSGFP